MTDTLTTKLGKTRAGERTRVWIEGARLNAAGFQVGRHFLKVWTDKGLAISLCDVATFNATPRAERGSVAGVAGRPIIDITGQVVASTFTGTHVRVTFYDRAITVTNV